MVEDAMEGNKVVDGAIPGFSSVASTRISWRSRKRSVRERSVSEEGTEATNTGTPEKRENVQVDEKMPDSTQAPELSERRKALFEPLEPPGSTRSLRMSAESLLPPPDFDSASYPKGWLIGKRRKLVNVDVVESMRSIAVQEMNRKDREIDGLNEQLEEDARCLEHLQLQLLDEKSKRAETERENTMLRDQISMLMTMMEENEPLEDGQDPEEP